MEENKTEMLELYKIHAKFANDIIIMRNRMNGFYISILSIFLPLSGFLGKNSALYPLITCFLGIILSIFWSFHIQSYKNLSAAKFHMLNEIENKLIIKPFAIEWKELKETRYTLLTEHEVKIPIIFGIIFSLQLIGLFYKILPLLISGIVP